MKELSVIELVRTLLGSISFHGETNHDMKALARLDDYFYLIDELLDMVVDLVKVRNHYETSARALGDKAYEYLESIKEHIVDEYLLRYKNKEESQ